MGPIRFGNLYYCVTSDACRQNVYVRSMVWSIGLSFRIYLYSIECSHLALLALSLCLSFSLLRSTTYEGKRKIWNPHAHTLSTHSINFFSVAPPKSLPKPIDCHIPARRKNETANVPSLLTRPFASGNFRVGEVNVDVIEWILFSLARNSIKFMTYGQKTI